MLFSGLEASPNISWVAARYCQKLFPPIPTHLAKDKSDEGIYELFVVSTHQLLPAHLVNIEIASDLVLDLVRRNWPAVAKMRVELDKAGAGTGELDRILATGDATAADNRQPPLRQFVQLRDGGEGKGLERLARQASRLGNGLGDGLALMGLAACEPKFPYQTSA